ncbi:MAG: hypothetical protein ABIF19_18060 [Planctomycetota bacterium]
MILKRGMGDYLIWNCTWPEIPQQDWPEPGMPFVTKVHPKGREQCVTGPDGWLVMTMGDGTLENDITRRGVFWTKADAVTFAAALADKQAGEEVSDE